LSQSTTHLHHTTPFLMAITHTTLSHLLRFIIVGLSMAIFLAALDQTIVSTATPSITSDLKAFSDFSWISTAYLLTSTALQPLYGKFSDIFGRKYVLFWFFSFYFTFFN
jgi:MFS family permease